MLQMAGDAAVWAQAARHERQIENGPHASPEGCRAEAGGGGEGLMQARHGRLEWALGKGSESGKGPLPPA